MEARNVREMVASLKPIMPFASGHSRAQLAIIFLAAGILLDGIAVVWGFFEIALLSRAMAGQTVAEAEAAASDSQGLFIALLQMVVYVVTAVLFLIWIYRAHQNLPALGALGLKYSPGWAVGWFFVPCLNLIRPFQVVTEIWKASSPEMDSKDGTSWQYATTSPIIAFWWGAWIVSNILGRLDFRMSFNAETADALITAIQVSILSCIVSAIAAVLAIIMISQMDARQEEKNRRLMASTEPPHGLAVGQGL
ncbi:MAG TPA: DUF4328 domain-containing protein [Blastocatellia bacterium]|nr:DUF4328 domain-containing protein [Blastocatellia bacterium]